MAIKTYKKGSAEFVTDNFRAREFDCPGKGCCTETLISEKTAAYLQQIRKHFGEPIPGPTGYRCPTHNAKVKNAAPNSLHTKGRAVDFHINGVEPAEIAKYAEAIGVLGIGLYDDFVHIDDRTKKSFWIGHEQKAVSTFGGSAYTLNFSVLRKGDKGEDVRALQILLKGRGYNVGATGNFGDGTVSALNKFKKANGLTEDGIVDEKTMAKLMGV
jgi:hypothetical protein